MTATNRIRNVARIAVLRANGLGDYLFCLPALEALRAAYPDAEIVLLGAPWHARLLSGRPGPVDRVVVVPALPGVRAEEPDDPAPAAGAEEFYDKLRADGFDLAIQLHGGGRNSNPVVARLGARVTAGSRTPDAAPLDRTIRYTFYQPEVFRYLEVVALVGAAPVAITPRFELTTADHAAAASITGPRQRSRVALHPGASDERRRWPAERFANVGDALAAVGAEVVVTGTEPERDLVERVAGGMAAQARPLVGSLPLGALAAMYAGCSLVISNDTGPLHLAAAVGAPTVGLYWVGNLINGAGPYRDRNRAVASWTTHCPECGADCTLEAYPHRAGPSACDHRPSFVTDITVAEVLDEALDLLDGAAA